MTDYGPSGMRRPDNNATIASTAATLRQHANSVQSGFHSFGSVAANTVVTATITFPEPFATPPNVIPGLRTGVAGTSHQMVWATGISATGFTLACKSLTAAPLQASWIATGQGTEVGG